MNTFLIFRRNISVIVRREPDVIMDAHWDFIVKNEKALMAIVRRGCRGHWNLCEEIYSDIVLGKMKAIFATFKPELGTPIMVHVRSNLKW